MADTESTGGGASGPTVSVMSSEQVTELITSLTAAILGLEQKLSNIEKELHGINQVLFGHLPVLSNIERRVIESGVVVSHALNEVSDKVSVLSTISDQLNADITDKDDLNLEYDTKLGVRSIGYILASAHELNLLKLKKAEEADTSSGGDSSGDDGDDDTSSADASALSNTIIDKTERMFNDLASFECDVTPDERIKFKTSSMFSTSRIGLPFDYTRYFATTLASELTQTDSENVEITEYALLVYDSAMKTSVADGSTSVNKVKSWDDIKIIQTIVIVENKLDKTAYVYMPSKEGFTTLEPEKYKNVQVAMDAAVNKYLDSMDSMFKGVAVIPVATIEQGITLETYRIAAKNITPACEYA